MSWSCNLCSSSQPAGATYCSICQFSKPMDRKGIPQIFAGYSIHFNGVVPRTLVHPSHAVEWRMAERHGAVCHLDFDMDEVNLLIYRPGYERSDKCRRCIAGGKIMAVSIRWMLDSLLETRQIHPSLYQLTSIPDVANPTSTGIDLPHYQHPYFLLNAREYAIPTSFPPTMMDRLSSQQGSISGPSSTNRQAGGPSQGGGGGEPPTFEIPRISNTVKDVYVSALDSLKGRKPTQGGDGEFLGDRKERTGVEILPSEQHRSKVDTMLFSGMVMVLSNLLCENSNLRETLGLCGAKVIPCGSNPLPVLRSSATHALYHHDDKKSEFLIQAAQVQQTERPGLVLCESVWVEDCLLLGELIPPCSEYVPTAKLLDTLKKKREKMGVTGKTA